MTKKTTTVAGERLEDLEAALDCFDIELEPCGCVNMSGTLPTHLSQSLNRALKSIEADMAAGVDTATFNEMGVNPMRELFRRIGFEINGEAS